MLVNLILFYTRINKTNKNDYVMNIGSQHLGLLGTKTVSFTETQTAVNPVPDGVLGNKHNQHGVVQKCPTT